MHVFMPQLLLAIDIMGDESVLNSRHQMWIQLIPKDNGVKEEFPKSPASGLFIIILSSVTSRFVDYMSLQGSIFL